MATGSKGNCYVCGAELGKTAMKNHLLKMHGVQDDGQDCFLLKAEGRYDKDYWIYFDIPLDKRFSRIDEFLRKIWLECCGHMSEFQGAGKNSKAGQFSVGDKFLHEYDFGTTTECLLTIVGATTRSPQKNAVRLLARNVPPRLVCSSCGKEADAICTECIWDSDNPFFCDACAEAHEHEGMLLPVTNSPRMGECGYCGELDTFAFNPAKLPRM